MKRTFLLITCLGALLVSACGGDSKLPTPTGKGSIRMINAIAGSPEIVFLIEERTIGGVRYKNSSAPVRYDDIDYVFNFEIVYPGDATLTRVASQALTVEKDREHIFLLTGDINAPTVTIWNGDRREWEESDTVFEARFAHAGASLGEVDVYFDDAGVALGTNPPIATLSFGEIADATDFEAGPHVMTVTAANDPNTVYFISTETDLLPQFAHVITVFDGDGNDTAPVAVRSMTAVGNPLVLTDAAYPPQTRFIQSAYTLETVDVYDDESLTNLVTEDVQFSVATADLDTVSDAKTYYFTPADSQATILFQQGFSAQAPGTFSHVYLVGDTDEWVGLREIPDRASALLSAKLRIFHAALNFNLFDVYIKDRDEPIAEEDLPTTIAVYRLPSELVRLDAGSYDIYLTERDSKTEISGPYPVDVALGDIVDLVAVDTVDPTVVELIDVPVP
jgi:hypothetical protein